MPLITVDNNPCRAYIEPHHSTHILTTLLHNDQLILVEIQGSLEYNSRENGDSSADIKLGDISWDETVSKHILAERLIIGFESISTHRTSSNGGASPNLKDSFSCVNRQAWSNSMGWRQRMATSHNYTEETGVWCSTGARVSGLKGKEWRMR